MYLDLISFYYIFKCCEKENEKKKMKIEMFYALRRNSKWIIISSTQHEKRGFYDSIHEFCVLSSPANLKFHTDHKNIENSKKMRM
jgi:hypothetical protein